MIIRPFKIEDWDVVDRIYAEGIATRTAVFSEARLSWEDWDASHLKTCRLVAEENGEVVGWTAVSKISNRCIDTGVVEVSSYVASNSRGKGVGKALLNALVTASEKEKIWMLQSQIIQENTASIRLCESCGFRNVGYRERINRDASGVWHNLLLMERRSKIVEGGSTPCGCGK